MRRRGWLSGGVGGVALVLSGFVGAVDCTTSRFRSVSGRATAVTLDGFDDQYASHPICAYQQTKDPNYSALLGCAWPRVGDVISNCGHALYPFTLNITLLAGDTYWFKGGGPEFTTVTVARSGGNGGLYTASGDETEGPSDDTTCARSRAFSNGSIAPITFYNGPLPTDLDCSSSSRSFAGCPFTCTLPEGCDVAYGKTLRPFSQTGYRTNFDGQDTSQTLFDHYGLNGASGPPAGAWSYLPDSAGVYTVMRRNSYTTESMNVARGQNRKNSLVEAYVLMGAINSSNREIGIASRVADANNYFVFGVREYGGDRAFINRVRSGSFSNLTTVTTTLNLLTWTQLGFKIRDLGSYVNGGFVRNGNCTMSGTVGGTSVVSLASTLCDTAPAGKYGVYSLYNSSAQFWDLNAYACDGSGVCFK